MELEGVQARQQERVQGEAAMNAITIMDLVSALGMLAAVGIVGVYWRNALQKDLRLFLIWLFVLLLLHNIMNFLYWSGIAGNFTPAEDYLQIMVAMLWLFVLYAFLRKEAEEGLRESEERLRMTLFGTGAGIWDWFVQTDEIVIDERWADIIGYTLDELKPMNVDTWEELMHPEDFQRSRILLDQHFVGRSDHYGCEVRIQHKEGHWIWVLDKGKVVEWDEDGYPLRMMGTYQDITEKKQAEHDLQQSIEHMKSLRDAEMDIVSKLDLDELLQDIITTAVALLDAKAGFIFTVGSDGEQLELKAHTGNKNLPDEQVLKRGAGLMSRVRNNRETITVKDYAEWQGQVPAWIEYYGHAPVICTPLMQQDKFYGVIEIQGEMGVPFSDQDTGLLELFSSQAAVAIRNASLFDQAQRRLRRLGSLREIDGAISGNLDLKTTLNILLDRLINDLGADAGNILLYEADRKVLRYITGQGFRTDRIQSTQLDIGDGQAGKAALGRRVVHISDLGELPSDYLRSDLYVAEKFISYIGLPLIAKGELVGVLEVFHRSSLDPSAEWLDFLHTLAGQAAIAINHINLINELQQSNKELIQAYDEIIEGWAQALELRDEATEGHSRRVEQLTISIARKFGFEGMELANIRRGALLHDIGKMGVPDHILRKEGELTDAEWNLMKKHPIFARDLLAPIEYLQSAVDIPYCHHEKWDGTGYPRGLKGEEIPLPARIFAVVDVWDALHSKRSYRDAMEDQKVLDYIKDQAGKHFDPQVVDIFLKIIGEKGLFPRG